MKYKFFTNSQKAWRAMYEEVASATSSVYLEMYIFSGDIKGFDFTEMLATKARSGVKVRMILDAYGSSELPKRSISILRDAGAEVLFMSHLLHRVHRKILVVDEKVAFLGGANLHESSRSWQDLMVSMRGGIVSRVIRAFTKDYVASGGEDGSILKKNKKIILDRTHTWLYEHLPLGKRSVLKRLYKKNISEAKSSIFIATPYFAPKRSLLALMHQAVLRGVPVTILVPENTEHKVLTKANYFYMARAEKLGIHFELEPFMNHAKLMIVDANMAIVGSQNLDFLSFELNSEIGLLFKDQKAVEKIRNIVATWRRDAKTFDPKDYRLAWHDKILAHILNFFVRML